MIIQETSGSNHNAITLSFQTTDSEEIADAEVRQLVYKFDILIAQGITEISVDFVGIKDFDADREFWLKLLELSQRMRLVGGHLKKIRIKRIHFLQLPRDLHNLVEKVGGD